MTTADSQVQLRLRVAALYADTDLSRAEIAAELGVSPRMVQETVSFVYRRLRVHSRAELRYVMLTLELAPAGAL